jgi:cation transport ATPase
LPKVMDVSDQAHRVVKANLTFASIVIASLVIIDLIWVLPLPLGAAGHEGSTVVIGLNGLRLLRRSVWERAGGFAGRQNDTGPSGTSSGV